MLSTLSRHVRHNVVGYLALFAALGGTSYAAAQLPSGSVGTPQLRNAAVTAAKVKAHSLLASDFARGQLRRPARKAPPGRTGHGGPTDRRGHRVRRVPPGHKARKAIRAQLTPPSRRVRPSFSRAPPPL